MLKGLKSVDLNIIQMYHFWLKWKRYTVCTNWWDSNFFGVGLPLFPVGLLLFARWESSTPVFKILVRALVLGSNDRPFWNLQYFLNLINQSETSIHNQRKWCLNYWNWSINKKSYNCFNLSGVTHFVNQKLISCSTSCVYLSNTHQCLSAIFRLLLE